jgi:hypothetical protein
MIDHHHRLSRPSGGYESEESIAIGKARPERQGRVVVTEAKWELWVLGYVNETRKCRHLGVQGKCGGAKMRGSPI